MLAGASCTQQALLLQPAALLEMTTKSYHKQRQKALQSQPPNEKQNCQADLAGPQCKQQKHSCDFTTTSAEPVAQCHGNGVWHSVSVFDVAVTMQGIPTSVVGPCHHPATKHTVLCIPTSVVGHLHFNRCKDTEHRHVSGWAQPSTTPRTHPHISGWSCHVNSSR
jgi:hypothetical protein